MGVQDLIDRHRDTLAAATAAITTREHFSAYPEALKAQPEEALAAGQKAFEAHLGSTFPLEGPVGATTVSTERSPFGIALDISYPRPDIDALVPAMRAAMAPWRALTPQARAAVCVEIITRLHARSVEIGHAVMHTSGQAYGMAFQAGGPHAQDRALEAVAYALTEMTRHPAEARWEKPAGRRGPLVMTKRFTVVPRGIALVIGCNTFPTWNAYPGLFASLATGNAVLVKPHPRAVLPLAITVSVARQVLAEAGLDPDLVALAVEEPEERLAATLAQHPDVRIIDFTGSPTFGEWLERNAPQAQVYTEKAGVNTVVIDSTDDYDGMLANLAFSLSLYSGQMCTAPQNLLIPRGGIAAGSERKSFDEVVADLAAAVNTLVGEPKRAVEILGAIVSEDVLRRLEQAQQLPGLALRTRTVDHPAYPGATIRTPTIVTTTDEELYGQECFGPVAFAIGTESTEDSIEVFRRTVAAKGAMTASVYSTDEGMLEAMELAAQDVGVALSCNLTGGVYVNQSAAFSDFHGTGANPASNSTFTDGAYVASRFRIIQSRR